MILEGAPDFRQNRRNRTGRPEKPAEQAEQNRRGGETGGKVRRFFRTTKKTCHAAGLSDISKKGGKLITAKPAIMKKPEVLVVVLSNSFLCLWL